ncbi:MAG: HAMP domain-containing sensor histidine kinase [Proteobacteria bacterium]|nr:HAMP domain-containing sensor histidine kinase [Pseudomonadota bacterium]
MPNLLPQLPAAQAFIRGMSLQSRFLFIIGTSSLLFALVIWQIFNNVTEHMIERLGVRFAEKQVLYDKARTLQPLIREIALARRMADSDIIKRWAANEQDPQLRAAALSKMESYRHNFQDGSYFLALANSGNFYFNDARGQFTGKQLRYTLNRADPDNAWFYATMNSPQDYDINIEPDNKLGVTKVWINVLLRDGNKVLGVIGTGMDLSEFIRNVADINQPGITNIFLDDEAAIQIYHDEKYIDFDSITKSMDKRKSIDQLLEQADDRNWVRRAIAQTTADNKRVPTRFVHIKGKYYLAGVAALPEVGWFDVTLLDLDVLLPHRDFFDMALAVGGGVLGVLLILAFSLQRQVLKPLAELKNAAARISQGNFTANAMEQSSGEVEQLASQFNLMTDYIEKNKKRMEMEVAKRTDELSDAKHMLEISLQQEKEGRLAQTNLLALMAHEVRSPVAVIGNTTQMLNALAILEKPDWLPRIEKIMVAVRQLAHLMDEVLAEDRITLRVNILERQIGDLNTFCAKLQIRMMARHQRDILFERCAETVLLNVDWHLVDIAVSNLIENAIKYSSPSRAIGLRVVHAQDGSASIEVHDHGEAISPDIQSQIFEKFTCGQPIKEGGGVGLGLYLVSWIAQLHGGRADVISSAEGNTFRIMFS